MSALPTVSRTTYFSAKKYSTSKSWPALPRIRFSFMWPASGLYGWTLCKYL